MKTHDQQPNYQKNFQLYIKASQILEKNNHVQRPDNFFLPEILLAERTLSTCLHRSLVLRYFDCYVRLINLSMQRFRDSRCAISILMIRSFLTVKIHVCKHPKIHLFQTVEAVTEPGFASDVDKQGRAQIVGAWINAHRA